jgi:hypothetical protein
VHHNNDYIRQLLAGVASGRPISQRSLARELGMALGLTNLLLRQLSRSGWIRIVRLKPNRAQYFITPEGMAEQSRRTREYFQRNVRVYAETRDLIRQSFQRLMARTVDSPTRIAFFGAGEIAELGYVVIAETGLQLVAVVDDQRTVPFFGAPVFPVSRLNGHMAGDHTYDALVVMSLDDPLDIRRRLADLGVEESRIHWLQEPPQAAPCSVARASGGRSRRVRSLQC